MPGRERRAQTQFGGQALHDGDALVAERGQRAGRAAELDHLDARADLVSRCRWAMNGIAQMAHLRPKVVGQRLLQMGAAGHDRAAVLGRLRRPAR